MLECKYTKYVVLLKSVSNTNVTLSTNLQFITNAIYSLYILETGA